MKRKYTCIQIETKNYLPFDGCGIEKINYELLCIDTVGKGVILW